MLDQVEKNQFSLVGINLHSTFAVIVTSWCRLFSACWEIDIMSQVQLPSGTWCIRCIWLYPEIIEYSIKYAYIP